MKKIKLPIEGPAVAMPIQGIAKARKKMGLFPKRGVSYMALGRKGEKR